MDDPMPDTPQDDISPAQSQLARLADGSLPARERASLREHAEADPRLAAELAEQERAVALMRSTDDAVAPASLRAAVSEMTGAAAAGSRGGRRDPTGIRLGVSRWRRSLFLPGATALVVIIAGVVIALGGSSRPTVGQTARVALAAATRPTPPVDPARRSVLRLRGAGIPFPSYVDSVEWRPSGARVDTLRGRHVTTVFYRAESGSGRVGYSIVSGRSLPEPDGTVQTVGGVRYVTAGVGSATLITWRRDGHTCVIAGASASRRTLLALAGADEQTAG